MDSKDIEKIINDRREANSFLLKNSAVYRAFAEMEQETYCDGFLEIRSKGPGILQTTG
jgi:hypothetical protein